MSGFPTSINIVMSYRIRCYTLFNITHSASVSRRPSINFTPAQLKDWELKRNAQANFDTVLQVISIRCQPENPSTPKVKTVDFSKEELFGFMYEQEEPQQYWTFDFDIEKDNVFDDGVSPLGFLFADCDGVPMVKTGTEWNKLPDFLDTSPELRNIHFEVLSDG